MYIQSLLAKLVNKKNLGLHQEDRLTLLCKINKHKADTLWKNVIRTFKSVGFKMEIVIKLREADFLDVTLNLENSAYQSYKKPNHNFF